jgi:3'(2'), 5'-bisphosphate nucleotidase
MEPTDLKELEQPIVDLARQAGRHVLRVYETAFEVQRKADKSPITEADTGAHDIIVAGLKELTPHWPVLSEEGADIAFARRDPWDRYWLVDPLDGTREFVKRNGEFAVIIALVEHHAPVLGAVHAPVLESVYYASRGNGAYKAAGAESPRPIHVQPVAGETVRVAGSRSHSDRRLSEYLERLGRHELVSMGSALKACLVAEGEADLYPRFGPTSEWDTAAAQCIVEEAGGALTDFQLRPLRYNTKESLLNPSFFVFGDKSRDWSAYLGSPAP